MRECVSLTVCVVTLTGVKKHCRWSGSEIMSQNHAVSATEWVPIHCWIGSSSDNVGFDGAIDKQSVSLLQCHTQWSSGWWHDHHVMQQCQTPESPSQNQTQSPRCTKQHDSATVIIMIILIISSPLKIWNTAFVTQKCVCHRPTVCVRVLWGSNRKHKKRGMLATRYVTNAATLPLYECFL